jgi:5-methylthioadenosine/S-adenosylhomocysteine deaminase
MATRGATLLASSPETTRIHAAYTVPVRPRGAVYSDYCTVLQGDRIVGLLPCAEAEDRWPDAEVVELPGHLLIPGLINAHTHTPMTLLRGYADDMDLHEWLTKHIWPAEREFVGPEFVADGSRLAIAEMLRSGTTCFNDMYFFSDATIEACLEAGMRASIGITVIEIETAWARDVGEYIDKGLALRERWQQEQLVSFTLSPHAPYTVSDDTLRRISELSNAFQLPVHMHLLETEWEVKQSSQQHDMHPLRRLEQLGLLNGRLQGVHMTQLSADDMTLLAEASAHVIHCPQSNLKLASGICPLTELKAAGVNVALGTDGAASNNDLDLLAEGQTAALLAKGISGDASAIDAFQVLDMMTINGARALGLQDRIGTIEVGKQADLCALDLSGPETQPLHHVVSQLVYAASTRQVSDVWIAGRRVLASGALVTLDLQSVLAAAGKWQSRLAGLERRLASESEEVAS